MLFFRSGFFVDEDNALELKHLDPNDPMPVMAAPTERFDTPRGLKAALRFYERLRIESGNDCRDVIA
jgi:hypothetical protein